MSRLDVFGVVAAVALATTVVPVQAGNQKSGSSPATATAAKSEAQPAASPGGGELTAVVGRVQKAYAALGSLTANFEQTSRLSAMSKPRVDTGRVEFKKGGKMRWDFVTPESRQFISDGKTLWIYSPSDKQVIVSDLSSGASQTAMNFMAGLGNLTRDFSTAAATEKEYQRPGMSALHLTPRESIGMLKRLTILVAEGDGVVREAYVQDQMNNVTHLVFSDLKLNGEIPDNRFMFEVPKGVEVIQPPGF